MDDEHNNQNNDSENEDNIQLSIASLQQLTSLETETLAAEIHLLGQLRDRLSPAARFAPKIQTKFGGHISKWKGVRTIGVFARRFPLR